MFPRLRTSCRPTAFPRPLPCPPKSTFSSSARQHATPAPRSQRSPYQTRSRPFIFVLGLMPIFTFGLGTWQIQRLKWKLDMIEQLENKLHKEPVRLPANIDPAAVPEFAYRKVYVTGEYDYEHELELGPKTREGELGYHVVTPLKRGEGQDTIMVNRGFVKREKRDREDRPASLVSCSHPCEGRPLTIFAEQEKGQVEVVGMLRDQEARNSFTPVNNPEKEQWVFSDIEEMAKHTGSEPVLVDEVFGEIATKLNAGIPVGRPAEIHLRNQHMTYAVTWYALSVATAFMFFRLVKKPTSAVSVREFRKVDR
uniref:SURF1-like protein n=1 Tax=Leucosporidium scottii TaxID=5278 RepID=A0A0H5GAB2_9BASI